MTTAPPTDLAAPDQALIQAIAREMDAALTGGGPATLPSETLPAFAMPDGYRVTAALRALRLEAGRRHAGRKIGFTNRSIWSRYGVDAPIWGDMWHDTVHDKVHDMGRMAPVSFPLLGLAQPRIEPEIVFGMAATPEPGMSPAALLGCIDWVAHGLEIVQCPFPGWRFTSADSIAAGGLHGALLLGEKVKPAADWTDRLENFTLTLSRDGQDRETGHARIVLDGPLHALGHLVSLLAADAENPALQPGETVTTGTLTDAYPVSPGEVWSTRIDGLPLAGLTVRFA